MPRNEVSERLQRIDVLLKQLDKVSRQAQDLHRMANELSHEAASSIRAARGVAPKGAADSASGRAHRTTANTRKRTRRPSRG